MRWVLSSTVAVIVASVAVGGSSLVLTADAHQPIIFVINHHKHGKDRLHRIDEELKRVGLDYARINAVDKESAAAAVASERVRVNATYIDPVSKTSHGY